MFLKSYISLAFPKDLWLINWNSAGWSMYNTDMNWSQTQAMYAQALQYIDAHLAELTANENMPPDFKDNFKSAVGFIPGN